MSSLWDRYQQYFLRDATLGFSLDISRMRFGDDFLAEDGAAGAAGFRRDGGAGKGRDRQPGRGPHGRPLLAARAAARADAGADGGDRGLQCGDPANSSRKVHASGRFTDVLLIGIGGSALGPQFVSDALGTDDDRMRAALFRQHRPGRHRPRARPRSPRGWSTRSSWSSRKAAARRRRATGCSKRRRPTKRRGSNFGKHAVAVTGAGSALDKYATANGWLARFPDVGLGRRAHVA